MNKKTRNVISGILVGVASIAAVINFADIPARDVGRFFVSTGLFFLGIVILALLAVSFFKLLGWLSRKVFHNEEAERSDDAESVTTDSLASDQSGNQDISGPIEADKTDGRE